MKKLHDHSFNPALSKNQYSEFKGKTYSMNECHLEKAEDLWLIPARICE
jgi:hypothetical protein